MSITKKPYEISIWKDKLVYVGKDGNTYDSAEAMAGITTADYQYYDEERLATIGSDIMTSPMRAHNPIFKKNINGTKTLTFDMYYQYEDIETGEIVRNPLIDLVIDERKVKLHYEDKWHDFIVKKDDEKGREYKYSYTCTGLAANELGKTGFSIELDTELQNNMGTVQELGEQVLNGSDWQLSDEGQEIIQQTNEEALYKVYTNTAVTANIRGSNSTKEVPNGGIIYIYYTPFANKETNYFQFIYVNNDGTPDLLEDKITINCNNTRTYDLYLDTATWNGEYPSFVNAGLGATVAPYRGLRYVKKQLTDYDPVLERPVLQYTKDGTVYYGYTTTEYIDTTTVQNYIYNSTNFAGTSYWGIYGNDTSKYIQARVFPDVKIATYNEKRDGYLSVNFGNTTATRLVNEGIIQNYSRIDKFTVGEEYRLRVLIYEYNDNSTNSTDDDTITLLNALPFKCVVKKYEKIDEDTPSKDVIYFDSTGITQTVENDYIIVDMPCLHSATWNDLKQTVGIFFFPLSANGKTYYIKDIQLFKKIIGKNDEVVNPDDPISNLPDVRVETKCNFYNPADNIGKIYAEDYIFSDSDPSLYTPLYGDGDHEFEKIRSITEAESNRFNLLQELSETFECWVRFEIEHDQNGHIQIEDYDYYDLVNLAEGASTAGYYIYDWYDKQYVAPTEAEAKEGQKYYSKVNRKRQVKKVIFYKEILIDNYAGFKYGINLKDNNRTLDSEQIVTKIIVKDNTCDQAENGFCSIARAKDNPIKENFVYNFDYYTSQGIIDYSALNNDLYLEDINGSIGLYPRLTSLNKERNDLIDSAAPLANSINDLTSEYQVAVLEYNAAEKELQRMKDPKSGTIYQYTHYIFEDFYNQIGRTEDNENVPSYGEEIYYIEAGNVTVTPDTGDLLYVIHTTDTEPQEGKTYYYISSSKFVEFHSSKFRTTSEYYEAVSAQGTAGTYFQTGAETTSLNFTVATGTQPEVYIYNAARRRIPGLGDEDYIDDNFTIATLEKIVTQQNNRDQAKVVMDRAGDDLKATQEQYDSIQEKLKNIANATDEVEKEFNVKYARYIQEGSWTDDNYMDDDLYYLDSLAVLYDSAYPKVSYNFNVIDLSQLEGYEPYKFDIAHKTFVEDVEFFGYQIVDNLRTPVKEVVVVTESSQYLDESDKNQLKVQNYRSHFEDLFQRITAATQSLEYHSGEYGRAAGAVTAEGTVSSNVMQKTFANSSYIISNSRDQSVTWDETGLQAVNLADPAQITRLASAGLLVSADGGQTWGTAISGYGINTNYLTAGTIDADNINIMSGAYPSFRWDSSGLRAYGYNADENGQIISYDPTRFVDYNRFGLFGINGVLNPNIDSLSDVENNAAFALTWNGLFMRAQHRDGFVRIGPDDDFSVYQTITVPTRSNTTQRDVLRAKLGLIETDQNDEEIFGLALYAVDASGNSVPTVKTQSDGTLWLLDSMRIGDSTDVNNAPRIYIGRGEDVDSSIWKVMRVYNSTDNDDRFALYSDGSIKATAGKIGNMEISAMQSTVGVRITPGNSEFKYDGSTATPTSITFTINHSFSGTITYKWYKGTTTNPTTIVGNSQTYTYTFSAADFANGVAYLKGEVTVNGATYSDRITLTYVEDGTSGEDGVVYTYEIESSLGTTINVTDLGPSQMTTITGHVYKTVGTGAPIEISTQVSNWRWYAIIDNAQEPTTLVYTTQSFSYSLGEWEKTQFYFMVDIS